MPEINNTKAYPSDIAIECVKTRKCGWQGMESDLVGIPHKTIKQMTQKVCPKCGCDTYYTRTVDAAITAWNKRAQPAGEAEAPTFIGKNVSVKSMSDGKIMVTMLCDAFEPAPQYSVQPINPAAVRAAPPAAANQAEAWQPIETAPKDGSMFLCWVSAVRYGEDDDGHHFEHDASTMDFCEWVKSGDDGYFMALAGPHGDSADGITHWMPMLAAPTASHALGGGDE